MIKTSLDLIIRGLLLRVLTINLGGSDQSLNIFGQFNSRHPKFPLLKRKTIGVEIIPLRNYKDFNKYLDEVSGKNSASYFRRRCLKKGYRFTQVDPDCYLDDILAINSSLPVRQGRAMEDEYLERKVSHYQKGDWDYLGVVDKDGRLVAYLFIHHIGELTFVGPVLGHGNYLKDGVMYLLFTEAVNFLICKMKTKYFMYDMYFGAKPGLKMFKSRIGFHPYRVKWILK